nr:MAG TPA: hypothetical protein [Caudoviricetes sp.]
MLAHVFVTPLLCGNYAILIATFYASFKCFGNHYCNLQLKEQGTYKSLVIIANSFLALFG